MKFYVIKHTDDRYVRFKAHSPYWTGDRFEAAAYETEADAMIAIRRFCLPHCKAVIREPLSATEALRHARKRSQEARTGDSRASGGIR